jgi:glycosyltransferase involved in cell wall biosynthesis
MILASRDARPLRILHTVGSLNRGGAETWLMHVLRHIDREQFQLDFLVETTEPATYDDEARAFGSRIIPCPHTNRPWQYGRDFKRLMREYGPYDIIHSHIHNYSGYVMRLAHAVGVPIRIVQSHTDRTSLWAQASLPRRAYIKLMQHWVHRYATHGLGVSKKAANSQFGPDWSADPRFRVLYCGIDLTPYAIPIDRTAVRASLGIPPDAFVIGHVGRFVDIKNHTFLVDIAAEVARRHSNTYLLLIGDGELRPAIEQQVAHEGLADRAIIGPQPEVPPLLRGAMDVFVLPSHFEGLPIVGMEAQTAGLPMVISDVVSDEMDVLHPLIQRLSLTQPVSVWADAVLAARPMEQAAALHNMQQSPFNIQTNIGHLEQLYRAASTGHNIVQTGTLAHI